MKFRQVPEQPIDKRKYQKRNKNNIKINENAIDILKVIGCSKSSSMGEIYSDKNSLN